MANEIIFQEGLTTIEEVETYYHELWAEKRKIKSVKILTSEGSSATYEYVSHLDNEMEKCIRWLQKMDPQTYPNRRVTKAPVWFGSM